MSRVRARKNATVAERLALHSTTAPSGCRVWIGARDDRGYGRFHLDGKTRYAHRVSYETHVGPIPDGLVIDHLCRYPACINPKHMQPVTQSVNILRGTSPGARANRRQACLRGHSYADHSIFQGGRRRCAACMAAHRRKYSAGAWERRHAGFLRLLAEQGRLDIDLDDISYMTTIYVVPDETEGAA